MKFFVARHGETLGNQDGVVQGHTGGELSSRGIQQAKDIARTVLGLSPTMFYVSDLSRTIQTYEHIIAECPGLVAVGMSRETRLRERYFGTLEGASSIGIDWASYWLRGDNVAVHGEETNNQFRRRVAQFSVEAIRAMRPDSCVVCITHGGVMNIMKQFECGDAFEPKKRDNTEIVEVDCAHLQKGATQFLSNNR